MSIDHGKVLALAKKLAPLKAMPFEFDNGPAGDDQWCVCTKDSNLTGCDMDKEDAELFAYAVNALAQPAEAVEGVIEIMRGVVADMALSVPRQSKTVNQELVFAWHERLSNAYQELRRLTTTAGGDNVHDAAQGAVAPDLQALLNGLWPKGQDTHPQAAPAQGDGWRLCYSAVIHALAAIVNVRCPDKLFDLDAIPRGPVMDQVVLIREAMDRFGKVHAAAPSQEGES